MKCLCNQTYLKSVMLVGSQQLCLNQMTGQVCIHQVQVLDKKYSVITKNIFMLLTHAISHRDRCILFDSVTVIICMQTNSETSTAESYNRQ